MQENCSYQMVPAGQAEYEVEFQCNSCSGTEEFTPSAAGCAKRQVDPSRDGSV